MHSLLRFLGLTLANVRDWTFGVVGILGAIWVMGLADGDFARAVPLFVGFVAVFLAALWASYRVLARLGPRDDRAGRLERPCRSRRSTQEPE